MNIPLENLEILQQSVNKLKKENKELKSKYKDLMLDFKMFDFNPIKQENEKLTKAIEILKDKKVVVGILLVFPKLENYNRHTLEEYQLTQEEYDSKWCIYYRGKCLFGEK